jgi:hypothetical protein
MDMIYEPTNLDWLTLQLGANATQIGIEFGLDTWIDEWLSILRAEDNVHIVFYQ